MSGHSHAANIKHKKAAADAKKGRLFSKYARMIMAAARTGGADPDANLALKYAIEKAKAANMPRDTIERAIKKGTGEIEGEQLVETTFEAVAPGGVALLVECLTDNKNRTIPELRKIAEQRGAKMSQVGWMFEKKGVILVSKDAITEDELLALALEAGADDMQEREEGFEVVTAPAAFEAVRRAIEARGVKPEVAEIMTIPKNKVEIADPRVAKRVLELIDALEDHDDVQNVAANHEIPDAVAAEAKALAS